MKTPKKGGREKLVREALKTSKKSSSGRIALAGVLRGLPRNLSSQRGFATSDEVQK
jgi:hypothetical protein